jgi:hypothetical protein
MKKVVWALGMLALTSGIASAQDVNEIVPEPAYQAGTTDRASLDRALIANEHKVNDAFAKGDQAGFTALVAAEGTALDGTGYMRVSDMTGMFDKIKITGQRMSDEKVIWIDANTAVVTYKWTGAGTVDGQKVHSPVFASTVWTKKGDKWQAIFHQETDAMPPPAPTKK